MLHPRDGGDAHAFGPQFYDFVKRPPRVLEPVIRRAMSRAECPAAGIATISATSAASEREEAVADDISLAKLTVESTIDVVAGAVVDGHARHVCVPGEVGVRGSASQLISS